LGHEILESVTIVDKPATKVVTVIRGDCYTAAWCYIKCHYPRHRIDTVAGRVLNDAIEVDCAYDIWRHDRLKKATTRQGLAHRPLELKACPKSIAGTDLLSGDPVITRILKQ